MLFGVHRLASWPYLPHLWSPPAWPHLPMSLHSAGWNRPLAWLLQPPPSSGGLPACLQPWLAQLLLRHVAMLKKLFFPLLGIRFSFAVSFLPSFLAGALGPRMASTSQLLSCGWYREQGILSQPGASSRNQDWCGLHVASTPTCIPLSGAFRAITAFRSLPHGPPPAATVFPLLKPSPGQQARVGPVQENKKLPLF